MEKTMYNHLKETGICPIMVNPTDDAAVPAARALVEGGLHVCEVLTRNESGFKHLNDIAKEVPDIIVGAGSVMNLEHAKRVVDLGARFIVSPGFSRDIVEYCVKNNISVLPGCVTSTELMMALDYGINIVKFFPVFEMGGVPILKQLNGPFGNVEWVVTGGLNSDVFLPLLNYKNTLAAGGEWMIEENNALVDHNYEQIVINTRKAVNDVKAMRAANKASSCN